VVAESEVDDRAAEDGDGVGEEQREVGVVDEHGHEGEVSGEGDEAVGSVEAEELLERGEMVATISPGVVEVPEEVVEQGELDGGGGGAEVVMGEEVIEDGERGELHDHAEGADEVEFEPTEERVHGRGSSR
jgi:hypothetical protein